MIFNYFNLIIIQRNYILVHMIKKYKFGIYNNYIKIKKKKFNINHLNYINLIWHFLYLILNIKIYIVVEKIVK